MIYFLSQFTTKDLPIIKLFYFIKEILNIILIVIPIILILMGTIDITKAIINQNEQKKIISKSIKRIMYGIIIFFVPLIVNYTTSLVGSNLNSNNLWNQANKETVKNLEALKKVELEASKKAYEENIKKIKEEEKAERERLKAEKEQYELNKEQNKSDDSASSTRDELVDLALKYVGKPYIWGGNNLNTGVDCSGFTQQVYKHFGISIPRTTGTQINVGKKVDINNLKKGDLIFYNAKSNHHVAIYIGGGKIVHAKGRKWGIVIDNVSYSSPLKGVSIIND